MIRNVDKKTLIVLFFIPLVLVVFFVYNKSVNTSLPVSLFSFQFPKPTGQFAVGTTTYYLEDKNRVEELSSNKFRRLAVHAWYPADGIIKKNKDLYLGSALPFFKQRCKQRCYLPIFVQDVLFANIHSYAHSNVTIAQKKKKYPVIIFSHGLGSLSHFHTAMLEELASHGYIVFGIDHTYDCQVVIFNNEDTIRFYKGWKSPHTKAYSRFVHAHKRIKVWVDDVAFVIQELNKLNLADTKKIFTGFLDMQRVGMLGHSMGGAAAVHMCSTNNNIKAGINMDGPLLHVNNDHVLQRPFMMLLAGESVDRTKRRLTRKERNFFGLAEDEEKQLRNTYLPPIQHLWSKKTCDMYLFEIEGAGHNTFCDFALVKKISSFFSLFNLEVGTIDPLKGIKIANTYVKDFFDKYLKNKPSRYLDAKTSLYNEVKIPVFCQKGGNESC